MSASCWGCGAEAVTENAGGDACAYHNRCQTCPAGNEEQLVGVLDPTDDELTYLCPSCDAEEIRRLEAIAVEIAAYDGVSEESQEYDLGTVSARDLLDDEVNG